MNLSLILKYSYRLLVRERLKFVLPFLSLVCTTIIVVVVIMMTTSANDFLSEKNKEILGGDVSLESNFPMPEGTLEKLIPTSLIEKSSSELTFASVLSCGNTSFPVRVQVVDSAYPLYGNILLRSGTYTAPSVTGMYIDSATERKCTSEGIISNPALANTTFDILGVVEQDPRQILGGFAFLPKIIMSSEGLARTGINTSLLRAEYNTYLKTSPLDSETQKKLSNEGAKLGYEVSISGVTRTGFIEGLVTVEQFLILTVLLVCILTSVNIYTGIMYIVRTLRKSFAVLLTLGLSKKELAGVIGFTLLYIVLGALLAGSLLGAATFSYVQTLAATYGGVSLPDISSPLPYVFTALVTLSVTLSAYIPSIRSFSGLSTRELLTQSEDTSTRHTLWTLLGIIITTLTPLVLLAIFLLEDIVLGASATLILASIYGVFAAIFYFGLSLLYKSRDRFRFFFRSIISFKKNDGIFGIVSVTSLYIAITSLSTLILLQSSLIQFLERDLGQTLPGLYVIDIQKSQTAQIQSEYPELTLFPNVGARILEIDGREILGSLARGEEETSGELGREYNLTYRSDMLSTENIVSGKWLSGIPNEVSVEESFAERAGIVLGSRVTLSIQGFTLESTVTSIRTSDRRSGLPFFFFVFNPQDLEKYPATFFGYGYYKEAQKNELITYIGKNFPNVSVIDTEGIAKFVGDVIRILTLIVLVIFIPPVFLAALLIMTLIVTAFKNRKKTSAQLRVLGATNTYTQKLYYAEMLAASTASVVLGYITSILVTYIVSTYYLKLDSIVWITYELLVVILGIGILVIVVAYTLWKRDGRSIREILSYEENS